jgi:DNA invertase Pin-like site-specific DNA recombinase
VGVRRIDRWSRSLPKLVVAFRKLINLGVGLVSLIKSLDPTKSNGQTIAEMSP